MRREETRVTRKYQMTIPKKVDNSATFLTSQIKTEMSLDAVGLVSECREEFG